jgi:SAM-dependent methyltransferase
MNRLPVADGAADAVLAECALCLSPDLDRSLAEARRALAPDGRLAMSDVVVEGELPALPEGLARAFCLEGSPGREALRERVEAAGFAVRGLRDHREDLLATRDRMQERVDYEALLGMLGARGQRLLEGIEALEAAVEDGRVGYVSLVADRR